MFDLCLTVLLRLSVFGKSKLNEIARIVANWEISNSSCYFFIWKIYTFNISINQIISSFLRSNISSPIYLKCCQLLVWTKVHTKSKILFICVFWILSAIIDSISGIVFRERGQPLRAKLPEIIRKLSTGYAACQLDCCAPRYHINYLL